MTQNPNQFVQAPLKGQMDLRISPAVMTCVIDSTSAGGLVAGQAVKMVNSAGGVPKVVECSSDADDVFGFLSYDLKSKTFGVGAAVEVAFGRGSVMYMEASAGIARQAAVEIVISGSKVATAASGKRIVGMALDKASAAGDLIRVMIDLPGALVP